MGKMKWFASMDDNLQQPIIRNTTHNRRRKRPSSALGHWLEEEPEEASLESLLRQIMWRIRRHWLALLFQFNRYTLGLFRKRILLKLGTVATLSYLLFFSDRDLWFLNQNPVSEFMQIGPVQTSLEVSEVQPESRSINWNIEKNAAPATQNSTKSLPVLKSTGNEAAPISSKQMRDDKALNYIERFAKTAVQEMHKFGIPASISLAQGLVESRYGTSKLAVRNNNHFGMKCFSKKCRNGHCSNFGDDHHKDFFRIYKTPWDSWRAHSLMLANGRYARLKKHGKDFRKWAQGLESLGYATDRTYAEKLIGVIRRYNLHQYDRR